MEKSEIKAFIAKRCAKELKDGDVVNLGIGLPTMIPSYLPEGVELIIHAELGIVSAGATPKEGDANYDPYHVIDAGGGVASVAFGGGFIDSATNFGLIRGGHVDACVLGCMEVDEEGSLANWIIPGKSMAGMGEKKYTFLVHTEANKSQIKEAVEKMFEGTKVKSVNTINMDGKNKRRGMVTGKTAKTKKAIVQLTADSKEIEIFAGL